jgi:hypothetical protein
VSPPLENLRASKDIKMELVKHYRDIKISAKEIIGKYEQKQRKPFFDEE